MRRRRAANLYIPANELEVIKKLRAQGVEYLVIGGYAMRFHGAVRDSEDVDLLTNNNPKNAGKLFRVVEALLGYSPPFTEHELALPRKRLDLRPHGFLMDILTSVEGLDFERAFRARETAFQESVEVPVASRESLLFIKRAAAARDESRREQEARDIDYLESLAN